MLVKNKLFLEQCVTGPGKRKLTNKCLVEVKTCFGSRLFCPLCTPCQSAVRTWSLSVHPSLLFPLALTLLYTPNRAVRTVMSWNKSPKLKWNLKSWRCWVLALPWHSLNAGVPDCYIQWVKWESTSSKVNFYEIWKIITLCSELLPPPVCHLLLSPNNTACGHVTLSLKHPSAWRFLRKGSTARTSPYLCLPPPYLCTVGMTRKLRVHEDGCWDRGMSSQIPNLVIISTYSS